MNTLFNRVEIDPRVCNGKPVIKGTRIPASVILEQVAVAEGESWDDVLSGYPELHREDIQAAILRHGFTRSCGDQRGWWLKFTEYILIRCSVSASSS
jgi:uncharacterized protein (DUF433 family)